MKKIILLISCLTLVWQSNAQVGEGVQAGSAKRASIQGKFLGFANPKSDDLELLPVLTPVVSKNESNDETTLQQLKEQWAAKKRQDIGQVEEEPESGSKTRGIDPVVVVGYNALGNQGTPSDNTCGVNKNGQLVAAVNSSIRTYNTNTGAGIGSIVGLQNFFSSFTNGSLLSSNTCDPKVIYDQQADRFIVFAQTCDGNSSTSQLLLAFSKSADPTGGYYFYQFTGNPSSAVGQNVWFDYPKIGVSNHDVFVTGNLFDNGMNYAQSVIYQIDKTKCYAGQTLATADASIWYNIPNSPFTMVPMSNGQSGGYGNNMYLVSTNHTSFGTNLSVYEITNAVQSAPQLVDQYVSITSAPSPGDGLQSGTNIDLQIGDNRGMDGYYLDGTIHYVFHSDAGGGYSGVNYSRLKKNGNTWQLQNNKVIKVTNKDCAFPSIASMAYTGNDQSSLIHFLCTSASDFPGMKAVFMDHNFQQSNVIDVKVGAGYVNYLASGGATRWGDYSGATRVHNATVPTVWVFGMYGNASHSWTNHFAKITSTAWALDVEDAAQADNSAIKVYPNPVEDVFQVELNIEESGKLNVDIYDISGILIKPLYASNVFTGKNLFSFNKGALAAGNYILRFTLNNKIIQNEKISVAGR